MRRTFHRIDGGEWVECSSPIPPLASPTYDEMAFAFAVELIRGGKHPTRDIPHDAMRMADILVKMRTRP